MLKRWTPIPDHCLKNVLFKKILRLKPLWKKEDRGLILGNGATLSELESDNENSYYLVARLKSIIFPLRSQQTKDILFIPFYERGQC